MPSPESLNETFTLAEVSEAIDRAKSGKSYLLIPNEAMKNANAKQLLHRFFNTCFKHGINPSDWSLSNIIPIPKPDKDRRDPLQNRCITILCCVAKVYSSMINNRLQTFLEHHACLVEEQNGFRSGRSCIDHIFALTTILRNRKALGKDTYLAFIDYKKAFDSVNRNMLFFKLSSIGIRGNIYNAIVSLYSNPKSRVVLNNLETEYFSCPQGVKQGDCLSPTLFAIYINDLAQEIKAANLGICLDSGEANDLDLTLSVLLYADDIVCMAESEEQLQSILFIVENWCRKWRLEVNMSKTNILHVRQKKRPQSRFIFLFDMKPVSYCSSYKYLGMNIDENFSFKFSVDSQVQAAERALSAVITKMIKNNGFPLNVYSTLYKSCVNSVSDYISPITGYEENECMLKLHLRAIRAFLGVPKNAPNVGVLSEIGWLMPHFRTRLSMIRLYHRLINMDNQRLTKKIFLWDKTLNDRKLISTWYSELKSIFHKCDLDLLFNLGVNFDLKFTSKFMEEKLMEMQALELSEKCKQYPKLRTFILFKDFSKDAVFIKKPLHYFNRRLMARLRLGCLPLNIETGRYNIPRIPEDLRVCEACRLSSEQLVVENESHFLFECKSYHHERERWLNSMTIPTNFLSLTNDLKLQIVLNEPLNIKPTAIFIANAMNIRSDLLNLRS